MATILAARVIDSKIYAYAAFTSTLQGTISAGAVAPQGVDFLTSGGVTSIIDGSISTMYLHAPGWSSTIVATAAHSTSFFGDLGHDSSNNVMAPTSLANRFNKYSGFSSTVIASFVAANTAKSADPDSAGNTVSNRAITAFPGWIKYSGFTPTPLATFQYPFISTIFGGDVDASDNTVARADSVLFGGIAFIIRFAGFTPTILNTLISPVSFIGGIAYFDGTFDFSILLSAAAAIVFDTTGGLELSLLVEATAAIVFGVPLAELTVTVCRWLTESVNDWMDVNGAAWMTAASGASWTTPGGDDWETEAAADWFRQKDCN